MRLVQALLAVTSIFYLFAVLVEVRNHDARSPPSAPRESVFPGAFTTSFCVLTAVSLAGLVDSLAGLVALLLGAPPPAATRRDFSRPAWLRPVAYLVLFWALEFMFEAMLLSGSATAWHKANAAGRMRSIFPLRYLAWMSTNAYMFAALGMALRLDAPQALAACGAISVCTLAAFPLELHPAGSALWLASAAASVSALLLCAGLVVRRLASLLPWAMPSEGAALVVLGAAALASYAAFPVIFFAANLCGGEGAGSCLPPRNEAYWWRITEGVAKAIVTVLALLCAALTTRVFERVDPFGATKHGAALRQLHVLTLPEKYSTATKTSEGSFAEAVQQALPVLICAPATAAVATYLGLETAFAAAAQGGAAEAVAFMRPWASALVGIAAAASLAVALDFAVRNQRMRHLASAFLPVGFFGEGYATRPEDFDANAMYYVEEPHATLLFTDMVSFTPASLAAAPLEVMQTLGKLFRHFDRLHAAAGATKVETVGDQYVSVCGATGPGVAVGSEVPTASAQAVTMATLALQLLQATSEHSWANGKPLEVRVGLHCGPLTTGVVGGALPRWGIFGRNVIVASRMESSGAAARVHCSAEFAAALLFAGPAADAFVLHPRTVDVKGLGELRTYWLEARESGAAGGAAGPSAGGRGGRNGSSPPQRHGTARACRVNGRPCAPQRG